MAKGAKRQSSVAPEPANKTPKMSANETVKKTRRNAKQAGAAPDQSPVPDVQEDKWPKAFCEKVKEKEEEILERLEKVKRKLEDDQRRFEAGILTVFRRAVLPIDPTGATEDPSTEETKLKVDIAAAGQESISERIGELVSASKDLIKHYNKLSADQEHESCLEEIRTTFKKDKQTALATLTAGRKVATADIQNMLVDRYHEVRVRSTITRDEDARGRMMLSRGEQGTQDVSRDGPGWGEVALGMRKGIDKLGQAVHKP